MAGAALGRARHLDIYEKKKRLVGNSLTYLGTLLKLPTMNRNAIIICCIISC